MIVSAEKAFLHAKKGNYPHFPKDWHISEHFTWNEVFVDELTSDGCPPLEIFRNALKASIKFEQIRILLGLAMFIHCWFRGEKHNIRAGGASRSSHKKAYAIDFHVDGLSADATRHKILEAGIQVRLEAGTTNRVHADIGNPYTKDYNWGLFNP